MEWEWQEGSILRTADQNTPCREIFQGVCDELGRYFAPMGVSYTRSARRLRQDGELLRCEIGLWSSHSNTSGQWVNLEIVTSLYARNAAGMERKRILSFAVRPRNFNVCGIDADLFGEVVGCIREKLKLARRLESREGLEQYLAELPELRRRRCWADPNTVLYLARMGLTKPSEEEQS